MPSAQGQGGLLSRESWEENNSPFPAALHDLQMTFKGLFEVTLLPASSHLPSFLAAFIYVYAEGRSQLISLEFC